MLELQSTLAANASVEQIAAQRAQHAEKVQDSGTSREQLSKAALERAELQSGRLAERAALQLQVEEKKAANVIKHAATQKQVRY